MKEPKFKIDDTIYFYGEKKIVDITVHYFYKLLNGSNVSEDEILDYTIPFKYKEVIVKYNLDTSEYNASIEDFYYIGRGNTNVEAIKDLEDEYIQYYC